MTSKRTLDHSSCFPAPKKRKGSSCFASSSSSTQPRWTYHVFLSFSGEDTRKNFTDHLYEALDQAGIHTFRDDKLPRGREISPELLKSIEGSRISIVVFSRNYTSSRWCLDELVKIIECKETIGQLVLPIFYDVDPSDLCDRKRCFGVAFRRHKKRYGDEMEKVEVRRVALSKAGNISGWVLKNVANGHEAELIRQVVEEVSCKLERTSLYVAKHPIGIESHVEHVSSLLSIGSDDVRMIGIYGMGGIGKTTIAKAVYNHIFFQFEWSCFLADVRECAGQSNGLAQLQERLLFALLGTKNLKVNSVHEGINLIKERLHSKKVLIVLDDMDHSRQLNTLVGNHDWFGPGSRIIITTRDEQLLNLLKVDERYMAKKLNHEESLQLFNSYAFGGTNPLENYAELANGIVHYAGGLPLALEVLGSYLFKTPLVEWKSAFDQLQRIPHEDVHKILKISFDALNQEMKDIFLDIACFFVGMDMDYVINILKCCDFSPEFGIRILINKCLLRVNRYNVLTMHDLLRDMGREINRQESPKELGKRRRLWFHKDVSFALENNRGTEIVEGVILTGLPMVKKIQWSNKAFARMHNLRLLQINHVHLSGNFEHLLKELRWLCWHNCPLEYLPSNFHPEKLVILDMQFSKIKTLWKDGEHFRSLKILNLSNSKCLTKGPIFCVLSMLEELLLEGCTSLMELHESIGLLDKLVHLNLKDCMNLRYLPGSVCKLKSVERLNLTGCAKLEEFPEYLGDMKSLTGLLADGTAIKQLPFSIRLLKNLRTFGCSRQLTTKSLFSRISSWVSQRRFLPSSVSGLCSLTDLCLSNCNMSERDFPADFGSLSSLRWLDLGRNNFKHLPDCFSHLSKLKLLKLNDCRSLRSISDLPPNLNKVVAYNCASLEKISGLSKLKTLRICLSNDQYGRFLSNGNNDGMEDPPCFQGARIIPFDRLNNLQNFLQHLGGMSRMREAYRTCTLNVGWLMSDDFHTGDLGDCFNDYEYSYNFINGRSFSYKITASSSISLEVPVLREEVDEYIAEFNVMIVYYRVGDEESWAMELVDYPSITITNKINGINLTHTPIFFAIPASCGVYTWKICLKVEDYFGYRIKGGDQLDISFTMPSPFKVKRGVMNLQTQCTYCYKVDSMHLLLQKKFNRQRYIHQIKKKNRVACSPLSLTIAHRLLTSH